MLLLDPNGTMGFHVFMASGKNIDRLLLVSVWVNNIQFQHSNQIIISEDF